MSVFQYNIAALVLLFVVFLSLRNKNIKSKSSRVYFSLIIISMIAAAFNLLSSVIINFNNANELLIRISQSGFICFFNLTYIIYFSYILSLDQRNSNRRIKIGLFLFSLAVVAVSILGVINDSIIKIDLGGKLINGIGMYTLYVLAIIYSIIMLIYVLIRKKELRGKNVIPVLFFAVIHIFSVALEFYYDKFRGENINVLSFSNSIAMLIIYISFENPNTYIDSETNALNSKTFYDEIDLLMKKKNKFELASVFFRDIKFLVEKMGYEVYGEIQKDITEYLHQNFSKRVFYISENQYVVLDGVKHLKKHQAEGIELKKHEINITPIVTPISYPEDFNTKEELLNILSVVRHDVEDSKEAIKTVQRRIEVEGHLKKAINDKSFVVYFQPIFSIRDGKYKSAEVLVRMPNNEAYPDEFIPHAEKLGLINKVDEIIMEKAFKVIRDNDLDKKLKRLEINLSPVECLNKELSKKVLKLLDKYKISPKFLNLELLETAEILENDIFTKNIKSLRDKGVGFSLDDFGTGYSNITNITNYPFNIIKIDKSILYNAFEKEKSRKLFVHLTNLIFNLGYDIIIEGVETEEQLALCRELGINNIQGYLFSKPINSEDFIKAIKGE